jgi:hypothetical protein
MGAFKPGLVQHADIVHLEKEINNLWGELNTSNISHSLRMELENKMAGLEEQFKAVMSGHASSEGLEEQLRVLDYTLAIGAVKQAEQEVSKIEHKSYHALENVRKGLENKEISPLRARHEVKEIMRGK